MILVDDRWPEPATGTREEAIKAALKGRRDQSRFALTSTESTATGVAVGEALLWHLEVWATAAFLPSVEREVIQYKFYEEIGFDLATGKPCQGSDAEVGLRLTTPLSAYMVGQVRRAAVVWIAQQIWPYPVPGEVESGEQEG